MIARLSLKLLISSGALAGMGCSANHPPTTESSASPPIDYSIISSGGDAAAATSDAGAATATTDQDASPAQIIAALAQDAGNGGTGNQPPDSICNPEMSIGSSAMFQNNVLRFGSISDDGMTMTWLMPVDGDDDSANIVFADRASTIDTFNTPKKITNTKIASDGITVSPDGTTIIAVAPNRKSLLVLERTTRADSFATGDSYAVDGINASVGNGEKIGDPVFGYGDLVLVFSIYGGSSSSNDTVRYAPRLSASSAFSSGAKLEVTELRAQGGKRRRPSGIGADFQTLFYWDEVSESQKVGHLQGTIGFFGVKDIGASRQWAQPSNDCSRVYFGTQSVLTAKTQ